MYQIPVVIKTVAPVVFSEKSGDTVLTSSKDYFSGNAIRGALAQKYIKNRLKPELQQQPVKDAVFAELFLSGKLRFIPAYFQNESGVIAQPAPNCLMVSKTGKFMDLANGEAPKPGYKMLKGMRFIVGNTVASAGIKKNIELHMSRNSDNERCLGRSEEGGIYNYESIAAGQSFVGYIEGDAECLKLLKEAFGAAKQTAYFGRSKNTQYGKCSLELLPMQEKSVTGGACGAKVYVYAYTPFVPKNTGFMEMRGALSDVVKALQPVAAVQIEELFASQGEVESFVSAWGAKRSRLRCINSGAIFGISKQDGTDWTKAELEQAAEILAAGVGRLTVEGYGQLYLWQPKAEWKQAEAGLAVIDKPEQFPVAVKNMTKNIINKYIAAQLQLWAADDVKTVKGIAGHNHLFGRLENIITDLKADGNYGAQWEQEIRKGSRAEKLLEQLKVNGHSLYDCLRLRNHELQHDVAVLPYAAKMDDLLDEKMLELANLVGCKLPKAESNVMYKTYWLWFCRLARKQMKGGERK